jgi:hypothetical protein
MEIESSIKLCNYMKSNEADSTEATKPLDVLESDSTEATKPLDVIESDSTEATKPLDVLESDSREATKPLDVIEDKPTEATKPLEVIESDSTEATKALDVIESDSTEATKALEVIEDKPTEVISESFNWKKSFLDMKKTNITLNWDNYKKNNGDLAHFNFLQLINHWLIYGKYESRIYNNVNLELSKNWCDISSHLSNNCHKHSDWAFIVTTCVRNKEHLGYLIECIRHIIRIYPNRHIYIINDNSTISIDFIKGKNIEILEPISPKAGELNPYLFAMSDLCKYDKLVYIHDTVMLKKNIDHFINRTEEINFFWHSIHSIHNDTIQIENTHILNNLYLYFSNSKMSIYNYINYININNIQFTVKFGSMSIFTKKFVHKLDLVTNIKDSAKYFTQRINRSFLERLLSIFHIFIYRNDYPITHSLCGNIMNHPSPFSNKNINTKLNIPLLKVWQGR